MCAHSTGFMQVVQTKRVIAFHAGNANYVETLSWPAWRRVLQLTQKCTKNGRLATCMRRS